MVAPDPMPPARPKPSPGDVRFATGTRPGAGAGAAERRRGDSEVVGSYALVRRLGSGGMGEVWLGQHIVSGGLGAVKRLLPGAQSRHVRDFFAREGRAIARLAHPHIVPVFEVGDGHLVTGFIDGANLSRRLQTPIDPATAIRITRQIAAALAHAHERGVVHRDVKPSNILLDSQGNAFLADFGVAAIAGEEEAPSAGTPAFMAPEQRRGERVGPAADQYALARTLIEMLAGARVPHHGERALGELPAALPQALRAAVERATAARPADRFASVSEMADKLGAVAETGLADLAPPLRLAAELRPAAPFAWCAGPHRTQALGADLVRADYRLSDLAGAGLPAAEVRALLDARGLAELGFAVWGSSARLGPLDDPRAFARAAEIVVLLHGWSCTREAWSGVAPAICRDNAQALVIAPDLHGFGETRFTRLPPPEHATPGSIARTADALRRLLGLAEVPTVMAGHSMSGIGLISVGDRDLGPYVTRVALNPVLPSHDRRFRWSLAIIRGFLATIGRIGAVRRFATRWLAARSPTERDLVPALRDGMTEEQLRLPTPVMLRLLDGFSRTPPSLARQQRLSLLVCVDDPIIDRRALDAAIAEIGLEAAQIRWLATGGHHPHLEVVEHPEWTARNVAEIVAEIDTMLLTAREPTIAAAAPSSTPAEPTRTAGATTVIGPRRAEAAEPTVPSQNTATSPDGDTDRG
jgi:serine/threonine-protein kinase